MKKSPITSEFFLTFMDFLANAKNLLLSVSNKYGVTSMQTMTLVITDNAQPRSMGGLCRMFGCDASNMTGIIDGLEQKGLVARRPHPDDRRIKIICLTNSGERLKHDIVHAAAANSAHLFEPLNNEEITQLTTILAKLTATKPIHKARATT